MCFSSKTNPLVYATLRLYVTGVYTSQDINYFWFMRHRGFTLLVFAQVKLSITSGICDTEALIDIFKN